MKLDILLIIAVIIVIQISCKKNKKSDSKNNNESICNTVFYSYCEKAIKFDTTAIAQSNSNFSIDSIVAKFKITIHTTGTRDSGCVVSLLNQSLGNIVYINWDFGDGIHSNLNNPVHSYFIDGFFTIKLIEINQYGKSDTAMFSFNYNLGPRLFFPNTFTPNYDGCNDIFRPCGIHIDTSSNNYTLTIKDKDNNTLFQTHNFVKAFDATYIDFNKYKDGEIFNAEFSAKTTSGNSINGCTPLEMRLSSFSSSDTNIVLGDQLDPWWGKIYNTADPLCQYKKRFK